jgi:hypothetical protein
MTIDLSEANNITPEQVGELLSSPACVGGFGCLRTDAQRWAVLDSGSLEFKVKVNPDQINGIAEELVDLYKLGLFISKSQAVNFLKTNLSYTGRQPEVYKGEVKYIDVFPAKMWELVPSDTGPPTSARSSSLVPKTLASLALQVALDRKDEGGWEWIQDVWLHPDVRTFGFQIYKGGNVRIWTDWLTGKLPWKVPTILGWSDAYVSVMYKRYLNTAWMRCSSGNFKWKDVQMTALCVEYHVISDLNRRDVRLGG